MRLVTLASIVTLAWLVVGARVLAADVRDDSPTADLELLAGGDDARTAAEALFMLAQRDEHDLELARALGRYRASIARAPSGRYAGRAANRVDALESHAEGDFVPLARLERVRRDPSLANDRASIDALVRDAADFPPGLVRVEARMLAAEAYLGRLHRRADGLALLHAVVDDPKTDPLTARQAAREIVETHAQAGELDAARAEARALGTKLDPEFVKSIDRVARRRTLHFAALVDLGIVALLVAIALARRRGQIGAIARALRPSSIVAIAFGAYVAIAGGLLASSYEAGNARPFAVFGVAAAPLVIAARVWGAAGSPRPAARIARAFACASAALATAFVVLERIDPTYLEGFGL